MGPGGGAPGHGGDGGLLGGGGDTLETAPGGTHPALGRSFCSPERGERGSREYTKLGLENAPIVHAFTLTR